MTALPGVRPTDSILDRIVAAKQEQLSVQKRVEPEAMLRARLPDAAAQRSLRDAIAASEGVALIAEIKKASPSAGVLAPDLDPAAVAAAYGRGGAIGISVVTEANYFQGDLCWLSDARAALVSFATRPALLRKDFLTDPYELVQARAYGADAVLLIVALLDTPLLRDLIGIAAALQLDALVEVHTEAEAARAAAAGAGLLGINNRDLHTFEVDLATTERLRPLLPADAIVVAESGIHTRADVERLRRARVDAILVGEALMKAPDLPAKIAELLPERADGLLP